MVYKIEVINTRAYLFATLKIEADSVEEAMAKARKIVYEEYPEILYDYKLYNWGVVRG